MNDDLKRRLDRIREEGLWRECATLDSPPGPRITVGGRDYLHLCSNNYLDLANHPEVVEAARDAAARWGAGAGAARLITGTSRIAVELEEKLAEFKQAEAALLFSSGYLANLGVVTALAGPGDWLVCDSLNHASLIDAARLSGAVINVYPHGDAGAARRLLAAAPASARKIILTDGVFSMDGDLAPLRDLDALALEFGAWLVVDDAHGTGTIGPEGRGACAASGVRGPHLIQVVTLSKALGSQGAAVAGSREIIELMVNRARSFIFETALAPPAIGAAIAALGVVLSDGARRAALARNAALLRGKIAALGFPLPPNETPIIPVLMGENADALRAMEGLKARGYWVTAIRPPSVEPGRARLRVTVMSAHATADLERFAVDLAAAIPSAVRGVGRQWA